MQTLETNEAMAEWSAAHRRAGRTVGLVPTMGFLHEGHVSLMTSLRSQVDVLVVSIFVNPLQFAPGEDLDRYPRDPEGDAVKCAAAGTDILFVPRSFYPEGFDTSVAVAALTQRLCGATRPAHFGGVTTVVARLFGVTRCDVACFGEKDFQQLAVVRRMVRDLALPVRIVSGDLVRDRDGVALSSRNRYLSTEQRSRAASLHRALFAMRQASVQGERDAEALLSIGRALIDADRLDYLELVDVDTLEPVTHVDRPVRAVGAAYYGQTRLLDNVAISPERSWM
jgi:pantoate--beta-alanine ligase